MSDPGPRPATLAPEPTSPGMRFAVETWAPEYGAPSGEEAVLAESTSEVDAWAECGPEQWRPLDPPPGAVAPDRLLFVDGVRRVEATVWITVPTNGSAGSSGDVHQALCASYAAGAVCCDGTARLVGAEVRRSLLCAVAEAEPIHTRHGRFAVEVAAAHEPTDLTLLLQARMARLEVAVATAHRGDVPVVVVDGPLRDGHDAPGMVGFVKTHRSAYGPPLVRETVARLGVGQRTPLLLLGTVRNRWSWYLRLPGEISHGWAGIVRLELRADRPVAEAAALADGLARALPRFASVPQKDPRAPQNLVPVGGLERDLRRRLGDPALLFRALRRAAWASAAR